MKNLKLLLTENVDNLGIVGDVVTVKHGYARNFLLPRGYATKPTDGAVQRLAARRAQVEAEMKARHEQLKALLEKLQNYELTMQRSANEQGVLFGGVSQHEIAQALRNEGFAVDDRAVRIGVQIKRLDSYHIPIVLASDLKTEIKLWIVSDKPLDPEQAKAMQQDAAVEVVVEEDKPRKKKPRKSEEPAEEASAPQPAEKPKKSAKSKKE